MEENAHDAKNCGAALRADTDFLFCACGNCVATDKNVLLVFESGEAIALSSAWSDIYCIREDALYAVVLARDGRMRYALCDVNGRLLTEPVYASLSAAQGGVLFQIDGVYGAGTENAVRAFQQSFGLPATGITDEDTWYRIIYIYTAVTKLAELTSEGERPVSDDYPGRILTIGTRGIDVLRMQSYLRVISEADPNIPSTMIDGVYDVDTRDAVYAFQRDYGVVPTGVIDETTWNKIVNAYYYVLANAEVSEPYPGEPIARGSQGASVLFIQTALNAVNQHVPEIPSVADDGIFGEETERAVRAFQSYYGLTVDGIVGPETWRLLALEMGTSRELDESAKG